MKCAIIHHSIKHSTSSILNFVGICNTPKGGTMQVKVAGTIDTFDLIP